MNYAQPASYLKVRVPQPPRAKDGMRCQSNWWKEIMLHGPIPDPGRERRCRVIWILFVLVAIVVVGYALGAIVWLGLIPWGRW
jgi:hypothetical protein